MADKRGLLEKLTDVLKDKLLDVLDSLTPEPDAIPIPVRNDPRDPRTRR